MTMASLRILCGTARAMANERRWSPGAVRNGGSLAHAMRLDDIPKLSGGNLLGHLDEVKDHRIAFFHRFNRECGGIGRIGAFGSDLLVVNSPETLHEVLVEKA